MCRCRILPIAGFTIILSAASRNHRASTKSTTMFRSNKPHVNVSTLIYNSTLQGLFRDLQLTDRNHVEIRCEPFNASYYPSSREKIAPIVERIGVHVDCNCPLFQDISKHLHPLMLKSLRRAARADVKYIEQPQHDPDFAANKVSEVLEGRVSDPEAVLDAEAIDELE
nr:hypothetical protein CFP56_27946 [Quercus suber]